jgi:signal transduction histidine kinase
MIVKRFSVWHQSTLVLAMLVMCISSLRGQDIRSFDLRNYAHEIEASDLVLLDSLPQDTNRVKFLLDFGYILENICPDTAVLIYIEASDLAKTLQRPIEQGKAHMYMGIVASDQGEFEKSFAHYEDARLIFTEANSLLDLANLHVNLGVVYNFQSRWSEAAEHYYEAIEYYDSLGSYYHISVACGNVGGILMDSFQPEKALPYFERGYAASILSGDSSSISSALINLGFAQLSLLEFEQASQSYLEAIEIAEAITDYEDLYLANHNMSDVQSKMDRPAIALDYARKAYAYASKVERLYYNGNAAMNLGSRLLEVGNLEEAKMYLEVALKHGMQMESNELLADCHQQLAQIAKSQGKYEESLAHWEKYTEVSQLLMNEGNVDRLQKLEVEYQSVQKDKALLANELEIEQKDSKIRQEKLMRIATMGAGLLLAIIFALFIYNFIQRKRLYRKEIDFIKKEQTIASIQSYMDGEEQERLRLAKDLHDGLSGLLAATKLQFSAVQHKLPSGDQLQMNNALSSLDNASVEVRRIAHNMMPEMLISYGLVEALKSFFAGINASGQLHVEFQYYGKNARLPENIELSIYRIIQEVINNVIKHAQADEAIVQINWHDQLVVVTVEDDGVGFDLNEAQGKGGIGLKNLESRVDLLGSQLTIESAPGKGTFTYFEVDLHKKKETP